MKTVLSLTLLLALTLPVMAVEKAELDGRIRNLMSKLDILQSKSDKRIPPEQLRKAQGIVLLDRTKAGFIFAYQGGGGVALVRNPKSGKWSPPAFVSANEASLGFQIGGQQSFVAVLLMNTNSARLLGEGTFQFGGQASGTAGNASGGAESTVSSEEPLSLVYSDREGLYGGAAIKGDALSPDTKADIAYYGQYLTLKEILFDGKVKASPVATELAEKLESYCRKQPGPLTNAWTTRL